MTALDRLELELPDDWNERPRPDESIRELWANADGSTGVLQVSQLSEENRAFVASLPDLGVFAAQLGEGLGDGWGKAAGATHGGCALGKFGLATFLTGSHPAMLLLVTLSDTAAFMWTWLGPERDAPEIRQVLELVMGAT